MGYHGRIKIGNELVDRALSVLCVASMAISTYLLLSLVKGSTKYFDAGVTAGE